MHLFLVASFEFLIAMASNLIAIVHTASDFLLVFSNIAETGTVSSGDTIMSFKC